MIEEDLINVIIQEIDKLNALPSIEETNFINGYRKAIYDSCYLYKNLIKVKDELRQKIDKAIELLNKYNDNESNYYVPVDIVLRILKGSDKE